MQGGYSYLLPVSTDAQGHRHGGRPAAWDWPDSAVEVPIEELRDAAPDVTALAGLVAEPERAAAMGTCARAGRSPSSGSTRSSSGGTGCWRR